MIAPSQRVLCGPHVRLEPISAAHRDDLEAAVDADPGVFRHFGPPFIDGGVAGFIRAAADDARAGRRLAFAVIDLGTGRAIGSTSYYDWSTPDGRIEIGWTWYGAAAQGTHVNPACKLLLLAHAFDDLGAVRVALRCDADNARSRRAIAGIGATFEGVLRAHSRRQNGLPGNRDVAYFSILAGEWPAVRRRLSTRLASATRRGPAPGATQRDGSSP